MPVPVLPATLLVGLHADRRVFANLGEKADTVPRTYHKELVLGKLYDKAAGIWQVMLPAGEIDLDVILAKFADGAPAVVVPV